MESYISTVFHLTGLHTDVKGDFGFSNNMKNDDSDMADDKIEQLSTKV